MKKYNVIYRDEKGELQERVFFAETNAEIKAIDGFVAITSTSRVKHPTPHILQRVILGYQINNEIIDLADFYSACDELEKSIKKEEQSKNDTAVKKSKNDTTDKK